MGVWADWWAGEQAAHGTSAIDPTGMIPQNPVPQGGSFINPLASGATLSFGDEIVGGLGGLASMVGGNTYMHGYEKVRDAIRDDADQFRVRNPKTSMGLEIAGALPTAALPWGTVARTAGLGAKALQGARIGAVEGGIHGAGEGRGSYEDKARTAIEGAGLGMLGGAAVPIAIAGGVAGGRAIKQAAEDAGGFGGLMGDFASDVSGQGAKARHPTWRRAPKRGDIANKSTELVSLRGLPIPEAIAIAEKQPHLIPVGEAAALDEGIGAYVGGARNVKNYNDLKKVRERVYDYISQETRGADWYDRYRAFVAEVTGSNPLDALTMSRVQGLMSAGVDPGSEFGYAMKELNGVISGFPVKAARPAQHLAVENASAGARSAQTAEDRIAALDPIKGGKKTGKYATEVSPYPVMGPETYSAITDAPMMGHNGGPPMASTPARIPDRVQGTTGVNDFRALRQYEYTEPDGSPQRGATGAAGHNFMDYENTLMVDTANRNGLGGRSDWTGEKLQAAPWVLQKTLDIMSRRPKMTYEQAFAEANKTIADFADKHTLNATHEFRPGAGLGYMEELGAAPQAVKDAFDADPRRTWATAPGGRDAIYAGTGIPGTGFNMRVRPTTEMQGIYQPDNKALPLEFNPGQVARPLVGIETATGSGALQKGTKSMPAGDMAVAEAAERLRALADVQQASAAHTTYAGGPAGGRQAYNITMPRKLDPSEAASVRDIAKKYGFDDVVDRGNGITIENFVDGAPVLKPAQRKAFEAGIAGALPDAKEMSRVRTDSIYADMADEFRQGEGSGAASQKFLDSLVTPELREAFDANPYLAEAMLNKIDADRAFLGGMGHNGGPPMVTMGRKDVETVRRIIGSGRGWVDRLVDAVKAGIVPATALAIFSQDGEPSQGQASPQGLASLSS